MVKNRKKKFYAFIKETEEIDMYETRYQSHVCLLRLSWAHG
jgi:hypothetical protein